MQIENRLKRCKPALRGYRILKYAIYFVAIKPVEAIRLRARRVGLSGKFASLARFKDIHYGERCFIVGTGPSMSRGTYDSLEGEHIIGVNAVWLWAETGSPRPDYMVVTDPSALGKLLSKLPRDGTTFVSREAEGCNTLPMGMENRFRPDGIPRHFSRDITVCSYNGNSVVYHALQIAVYMGFKKIYLLGVDCNYSADGNWYSVDHGIRADNSEQTGLKMIDDFKIAKTELKGTDAEVFNAGDGGMLEVFPRVNLEDVIAGVE